MGLASTAALVSIQDQNGAVVTQANGATQLVTPGALVNFSLQNSQGIQRWDLQFNCPNFPALHLVTFSYVAGQANLLQVPLPPDQFVGRYTSTVSDGVSSIAYASGFIATKGSTAIPRSHSARLEAIAALAAYTNVNGTITANANGALANIDGTAAAVGDFVFLPPGIAVAAADVGIYQVVSLGGASSKFVFSLSPDWGLGGLIQSGTEIRIEEGTVYAGVTNVVTNTGISTIGTTTLTIFPREVIQSVTLVTGTVTIANVPILSATKTIATAERTTANTSTATTGGYNTIGGKTAGAFGTATLAFQACVAAGTINAADVSTLAVSIRNPV